MSDPSTHTTQGRDRRDCVATSDPAPPLRLLVLASRQAEANLVVRMLSEHRSGKFDCEAVTRAHDALLRLSRGQFEAVLVNGDALHGDPLTELERLCEFAASVPVLIVASETCPFPPAEALRHGAQDVLRRDELVPQRVAGAIACAIERQRRFAALRDLSLVDPLTGLHNRRGFRSVADAQLRLMRRNQRQSLLLFADVDHLKQINDAHGHTEGDHALRLCAAALVRSMRDSDVVARYGGDEFVALALDASAAAAFVLVPRLEATLADLARRSRLPYPLTMSVGSAGCGRSGSRLDEALERADRVLYGEKRRYRDAGPAASRPA